MSSDKAHEARTGLLDSLAGKAKEVAGAVVNRDDLVEEGQLQQAGARKRREAVGEEAVADAERDEAAEQLGETTADAAELEARARAEADRDAAVVEQQRAVEHSAAEADAIRQAEVGAAAAEDVADDVAEAGLAQAEDLEQSADQVEDRGDMEQERLRREAEIADDQAADLRAETES